MQLHTPERDIGVTSSPNRGLGFPLRSCQIGSIYSFLTSLKKGIDLGKKKPVFLAKESRRSSRVIYYHSVKKRTPEEKIQLPKSAASRPSEVTNLTNTASLGKPIKSQPKRQAAARPGPARRGSALAARLGSFLTN